MRKQHFQDWITLLVGAWLIVAPFTLTITLAEGQAQWPVTANFVLSGAAAVVLGVSALVNFRQWEEWLDVALGVWLIASPWVLGFTVSQSATWNAILGGLLIGGMGLWTTIDEGRHHAA